MSTWLLIPAVFRTQKWKRAKHLSVGGWVDKVWLDEQERSAQSRQLAPSVDEWVAVIALIERAAQALERWVAGELTALPQDLGFAPRTHVMSDAHSHLFLQHQGFQTLFWLPRAPTYTVHTPTHKHTHTHSQNTYK